MGDKDTEFTLTPGTILLMFLGFAAICGGFFGLGYSMGRHSTPLNVTLANSPSASSGTTAGKPQPGVSMATPVVQSPCQEDNCPQPAPAGATADKTAGAAATTTTGNAPQPDVKATADARPEPPKPEAPKPEAPKPQPPKEEKPVQAAGPTEPPVQARPPEVISPKQTGYMVQIAAVTRQEDAEVLVNALRKKNYPVFIANLPTDKLLHIQIGPFTDKSEAEVMRSRLSDDGYNAILK